MLEDKAQRPTQTRALSLPGGLKLYIAGAVVALALGYLFLTAFQGATVFYYTVDELRAQGAQIYGKQVRVNGKVVPDSIERHPEAVLVKFQLTDGKESLPVTFKGIPPDLFYQADADVVVEGRLGSDKTFVANNVITRCASKYEAQG